MDLLRDLSRRMGKTLVTSVHAVHFAQSHFDRIIGLREGRVLFDRPSGEVNPAMIRDLYRISDAARGGSQGERAGEGLAGTARYG